MEIAYNNNEAKKFYQEVKSIRKGCHKQMLLIRDKEGNRVNNNEKVLQRWSEYYKKHFELQDGTDMTVQKSGQCVYKLQNHMLNHQKCRQRWQ
jgi:nitric oxide synthase oxygenase domain/subunit